MWVVIQSSLKIHSNDWNLRKKRLLRQGCRETLNKIWRLVATYSSFRFNVPFKSGNSVNLVAPLLHSIFLQQERFIIFIKCSNPINLHNEVKYQYNRCSIKKHTPLSLPTYSLVSDAIFENAVWATSVKVFRFQTSLQRKCNYIWGIY